uniref:Uncharacterized protein n=1 Tax=Anguilla anguilla TaxID=7936 RepID=A0A0E9STF2_ANGAN
MEIVPTTVTEACWHPLSNRSFLYLCKNPPMADLKSYSTGILYMFNCNAFQRSRL